MKLGVPAAPQAVSDVFVIQGRGRGCKAEGDLGGEQRMCNKQTLAPNKMEG